MTQNDDEMSLSNIADRNRILCTSTQGYPYFSELLKFNHSAVGVNLPSNFEYVGPISDFKEQDRTARGRAYYMIVTNLNELRDGRMWATVVHCGPHVRGFRTWSKVEGHANQFIPMSESSRLHWFWCPCVSEGAKRAREVDVQLQLIYEARNTHSRVYYYCPCGEHKEGASFHKHIEACKYHQAYMEHGEFANEIQHLWTTKLQAKSNKKKEEKVTSEESERELERLKQENDRLMQENDRLVQENGHLRQENERLMQEDASGKRLHLDDILSALDE